MRWFTVGFVYHAFYLPVPHTSPPPLHLGWFSLVGSVCCLPLVGWLVRLLCCAGWFTPVGSVRWLPLPLPARILHICCSFAFWFLHLCLYFTVVGYAPPFLHLPRYRLVGQRFCRLDRCWPVQPHVYWRLLLPRGYNLYFTTHFTFTLPALRYAMPRACLLYTHAHMHTHTHTTHTYTHARYLLRFERTCARCGCCCCYLPHHTPPPLPATFPTPFLSILQTWRDFFFSSPPTSSVGTFWAGFL